MCVNTCGLVLVLLISNSPLAKKDPNRSSKLKRDRHNRNVLANHRPWVSQQPSVSPLCRSGFG